MGGLIWTQWESLDGLSSARALEFSSLSFELVRFVISHTHIHHILFYVTEN